MTERWPLTIISGGQTGADQAALRAARDCGIRTGGAIGRDFQTEDGPAPWLATYGLEPMAGGYTDRRATNVCAADLTVIYMPTRSVGSLGTARECDRYQHAYLFAATPRYLVPPPELAATISDSACIVNVAGNRASKSPGIGVLVYNHLIEVFRLLGYAPVAPQQGP